MEDLLQIESLLRPDEIAIRDSVRHFVTEHILPIINQSFEEGHFPSMLIPKLADLGLLGATFPQNYGGAQVGYVAYGLICQELERGDSGIRSFVSVQSSLCMYPIFRYGSESQKQKYLPLMAQGKLIACFGLTEPESGSDPASMHTFAKKVDSGWILNGSKMWITNAPIADLAIVWAKTDEGIRGFIVEKAFKGFTAKPIEHKMSLRASSTGELIFNNCFIPDENFLPGSIAGLSAPLSCLNQARYGIAWGATGAAQACFSMALEYAKNRRQFNKPIASFQLVQKDLVDMYTELNKASLLNLHIGRLREQEQHDPSMISMAKMNACQQALMIARKARNILGGNGITLDYHVIRHLLNLETVFTYEGTDNIHHLIIGKYLTGISAFE